MYKHPFNKTTVAISISMILATGVASAQQVEDQAVEEKQQARKIEVIEVTAQKRTQNLQEVGISVTAFSGDMMKEMGITELVKLQDSTPNLRINKDFGSSTTPKFSIRGVGALTNSDAVSSSPVAIHVNEVPYAFPVTSGGSLFDLAGVEVLRGPQGDLFGLNTTGGTVNFTTAKPTEDFEASITADIGNYETANFDGFVSGPISDTVAMRLALHSENRGEGYQTNVRTGENNGEIERFGARLTTSFNPSDSFSADLEIHHSYDKSDVIGLSVAEDFNYSTDILSEWFAGKAYDVYPAHTGKHDTDWTANPTYFAAGTKPFIDNEGTGASLRMNWDVSEFTISTVTGVEDFERFEWNDYDGSAIEDSDNIFGTEIQSFNQEIRIASNNDSDLSWVVGVNYGKDDIDSLNLFVQSNNIDFPAAAGQKFTQKRSMWSIFSHAEFQLNEEFRLIGGLRWTEESRDVTNIGTFAFQDSQGILDMFYGFKDNGGADFTVPGDTLTGFIVGDNTTVTDPKAGRNINKDYSGVNAKLALNWTPNDDTLYYASISHGFKSGGYGDIASSAWFQFDPSEKEVLTAYEVGSKFTLAEDTLRLNSALFYYDYEDQQVGGTFSDVSFGPLGTTVNVPKSEMYGFEVELVWMATDDILITQALGYTKGTYEEYTATVGDLARDIYAVEGTYPADNDPRIKQDLSGNDIGFPEVQYSGTVKYTKDLSSDYSMSFTADYSYESKEIDSLSKHNLDSFWLVNSRIALISDEWEVTLYVDNLLDEEYLNFKGQFNQSVGQSFGMPRTFGLRFTKEFY